MELAAVRRTLVIGHRGASGYLPEHTLASYELAARLGADFLEPDLVVTKDGVLVCRHENEIGGTTDVADHPRFSARRTTKVVDGAAVTGWFAEDFTIAELKTLRARERLPLVRPASARHDRLHQVPTFAELLALRARLSRELGRSVGVYPETKHPTYFRSLGLPLERRLVRALTAAGLNRRSAPVFVQSFELGNLLDLRERLGLLAPTVLLTSADGAPYDLQAAGDARGYADLTSPEGLQWLQRNGVSGIGPAKEQVIPRCADGSLGPPTSFVHDAHAAGLLVHPYTFRAENRFLPTTLRSGRDLDAAGYAVDELVAFLGSGIDGLFTDHPDVGVLARERCGAVAASAGAAVPVEAA